MRVTFTRFCVALIQILEQLKKMRRIQKAAHKVFPTDEYTEQLRGRTPDQARL